MEPKLPNNPKYQLNYKLGIQVLKMMFVELRLRE